MTPFIEDDVPPAEWLQFGHLATSAAALLWDFESWSLMNSRFVELTRSLGALAPLSIALNAYGIDATWRGNFQEATALVEEEGAIKDAMGIRLQSVAAIMLAAYRGRPDEARPLIAACATDSVARGEGMGLQLVDWTSAILDVGLGQYREALAAAERAAGEAFGPNMATWALPELVEAAVRCGEFQTASDAFSRFSGLIAEESDWAEGLAARCRALNTDGPDAEHWYSDAIARLARTPLRPDLARAHLVYGEWLRRENRRVDARLQFAHRVRVVHRHWRRGIRGAVPSRAGCNR